MLGRKQGDSIARRQPSGGLRPYSGGPQFFIDPFREMAAMQQQMDDVFSRFFGPSMTDFGRPFMAQGEMGIAEPDVDVYEDNQEYIVHAALPGVNPNDIQLEATDTGFTLTAESRSPFETQGQGQQASGNMSGQTTTPTMQSGQSQGGATQPSGAQTSGQPNQSNMGEPSNMVSSNTGSQTPHTQHLQSRYSRVSRFRFAYTFPDEIRPNDIRANFKNGRLELHLPKAQTANTNRSVSIPIMADDQSQSLGGAPSQQGISGQSGGSMGSNTDTQHTPRGETGDQRTPTSSPGGSSPVGDTTVRK